MIIIIVAIVLLLLAGILAGVFFYIKHRNATVTQFHVGGNNIKRNQPSSNVQPAIKNNANVNDIMDADELPPQRTSAGETGLTLGAGVSPGNIDINIGNPKQQKSKRGGYSKQQFDEFG